MTLEQYSAFINVIPQIETALKKKGEKIPRPNYGPQPGPGNQDDQDVDDNQIEDKKANIEATSDEDE